MLGDILLKLVNSLTPDDVRQLKAAGHESEVVALLATLDVIAATWRRAGVSDSQVWADVQIRLNELRSALRR
ncbi:hypothetical protein ES703_85181 [subsurface metagenome]